MLKTTDPDSRLGDGSRRHGLELPPRPWNIRGWKKIMLTR